MIGRYLLTLTPEEEGRVLTGKMVPLFGPDFLGAPYGSCGCLLMTANGARSWADIPARARHDMTGMAYEHLCKRFGTKRVNAAIRNRILANQLRRTLTPVREAVPA